MEKVAQFKQNFPELFQPTLGKGVLEEVPREFKETFPYLFQPQKVEIDQLIPEPEQIKLKTKDEVDFKHLAKEIGFDLFFTFLGMGVGLPRLATLPFRINRYIRLANSITRAVTKTKYIGPVAEAVAEEAWLAAKLGTILGLARKTVGPIVGVEERDIPELIKEFGIFGIGMRGVLGVVKEGFRFGLKAVPFSIDVIDKLVLQKVKPKKEVISLKDRVLKLFHQRAPEAVGVLRKLSSYNEQILARSIVRPLNEAFENTVVQKEWGDFVKNLAEPVKRLLGDEAAEDFILKVSAYHYPENPFLLTFLELAKQPQTPYQATKRLFWEQLEQQMPEVVEETWKAFWENAKLRLQRELNRIILTQHLERYIAKKPYVAQFAELEEALTKIDVPFLQNSLQKLNVALERLRVKDPEKLAFYQEELNSLIKDLRKFLDENPVVKNLNVFPEQILTELTEATRPLLKERIKALNTSITAVSLFQKLFGDFTPIKKTVRLPQEISKELSFWNNLFKALKAKKARRFVESVLKGSPPLQYSVLGYLFNDAIAQFRGRTEELFAHFGITASKIGGSQLKNLVKKFESYKFHLNRLRLLAREVIHHGDLTPIKDKLVDLLLYGGRNFWRYKETTEMPIFREIFDAYIPRVGIKHFFKPPYDKKTLVLEELQDEILRVFQRAPNWVYMYEPLQALKARKFRTLFESFQRGLGKYIIEAKAQGKTAEEIIEGIFDRFTFTGGLTLPHAIANRYIIPRFINEVYHKLDDVVKDPNLSKFLDPTKKELITLNWLGKTVKINREIAEALGDYFAVITGRHRTIYEGLSLVPINSLMKRLFLWFSVTFHGNVLALSTAALNLPWWTKMRIIINSLWDAIRVISTGVDNLSFHQKLIEIYRTTNALKNKGYDVVDIPISGYLEGFKRFGEYLLHLKGAIEGIKPYLKPETLQKIESLPWKRALNHSFFVPENMLWVGFYSGLKIRTASEAIKLFQKGVITEGQLANTFKSINDVFGGWHGWKYFSPKAQQMWRLLLFAPDWYVSLFNNLKTWATQTSPLVSHFYPSLLRLRFFVANALNYAIYGDSPVEHLDFSDPNNLLRFLLKDWREMFIIRFPITDKTGKKRLITIDVLGPEYETFELIGLAQFADRLLYVLEHPTLDFKQKISQLIAGTGFEFSGFWLTKLSSILRFFADFRDLIRKEKKELIDLNEMGNRVASSFFPLIFIQLLGIRYPYPTPKKYEDFFKIARFLNTLSFKIRANEIFADVIFEQRHNEAYINRYFNEWIRDYQEVLRQKEIFFKTPIPNRNLQRRIVEQLGNHYIKYFILPVLQREDPEDLRQAYKIGAQMLPQIREDITHSALPANYKTRIYEYIRNSYKKEIKRWFEIKKFKEFIKQ